MHEEFAGDLETHLTVELGACQSLAGLQEWASSRKLKCVHIVLARGATVSQPMATRRAKGTLSSEKLFAERLAQELAERGYRVNRIKIEAPPWNADVPVTDVEGRRHSPGRYFESHIKLLLPVGADLQALTMAAQRRAAHLSRNALKRRDDGAEERFLTQRCYGVGRETARRRLQELQADLEGYEVLDVEEEFVVYDSDATLDAGWLELG